MKAVRGYHLIKPEHLAWRPSNLMRIPNADYLDRSGSENLGARLWRLPPKSAKTRPDISLTFPVDPRQLPKEQAGMEWPPKS